MIGGIRDLFFNVLDLLLPDTCVLCKDVCGALCCTSCLSSISVSLHTDRHLEGVDGVISFLEYEGAVQRLFHVYKLEGHRRLGPLLASVILPTLKGIRSLPKVWVPVPSHAKRVRQRGFNHVEELFGPLLSGVGQCLQPVICRKVETPALFGLSKAERIRVLQNVFAPVDASLSFEGQDVLLCDDILTSGTTLEQCAKLCRELGAGRVMALTIAEVYDDDSG